MTSRNTIGGKKQIKISMNVEGNDSVKIMTIHKSKGLEYHICYFSGFDKPFNLDDLKHKENQNLIAIVNR